MDNERHLKQYLQRLVAAVEQHVALLDAEMNSTQGGYDRGQKIARICNRLVLEKDLAVRFGLKAKKPAAKTRAKEPA